MATNDVINVRVAQTERFFLYLPFYFAESKNFFNEIPESYRVTPRTTSAPSDVSACRDVLDVATAKTDAVWFAIADPAAIMEVPNYMASDPVLVCGLVTNAAFWAVDRKSIPVNRLDDLAKFKNIISFKEGTTSYAIAESVSAMGRANTSIDVVQPGQELIKLRESKSSTIALSPDLLGIHALISDERDYDIDLALGETHEYANVLVTALLTRADVLETHRELVMGLVRALQRAVLRIHLDDEEVIEFAANYFDKDEEEVTGALARAHAAQLFPTTLEVQKAQLLKRLDLASKERGDHWKQASSPEDFYNNFAKKHSQAVRRACRSVLWNGDGSPEASKQKGDVKQDKLGLSGWLLPTVLFIALALLNILVPRLYAPLEATILITYSTAGLLVVLGMSSMGLYLKRLLRRVGAATYGYLVMFLGYCMVWGAALAMLLVGFNVSHSLTIVGFGLVCILAATGDAVRKSQRD